MALKLKIKKAVFDALSADIKKEYILEGEDATLDVEGIEDTGALNRAKAREKQRADDLEAKLTEATEKNDRLERGKAGDVDRLTRRYDTEKADLVKVHTETLSKKDAFIRESLLDSAAVGLSAKLNKNSPKIFVPHVTARLDVDFSGDKPALVIKGADGKPSKMTLDDLQKEFVANKDFAGIIVGSQASGGAGTGNNKKPPGSAGGSNNGSGDGSNKTPDWSKAPTTSLVEHLKAKKAEAAAKAE